MFFHILLFLFTLFQYLPLLRSCPLPLLADLSHHTEPSLHITLMSLCHSPASGAPYFLLPHMDTPAFLGRPSKANLSMTASLLTPYPRLSLELPPLPHCLTKDTYPSASSSTLPEYSSTFSHCPLL